MSALDDFCVAEALGAAPFAGFEAESVRLRAAGSICMAGLGARGEAEGRQTRGTTHQECRDSDRGRSDKEGDGVMS